MIRNAPVRISLRDYDLLRITVNDEISVVGYENYLTVFFRITYGAHELLHDELVIEMIIM